MLNHSYKNSGPCFLFIMSLFVMQSYTRETNTLLSPNLVNSKVHKYGKSTTGESWDIVVDEETYYE